MEVIAGSQQEFEQVFKDRRLDLIRLAYLVSGSREDAEDIVQTVFAEAQNRWTSINDPYAYLRTAVVNRVKDGQRREFRKRLLPIPRERVTEVPEVDEMWHHIRQLPARQRSVVVLRFYEDMPLEEISSVLSQPSSTTRSDLRRALSTLKGKIQ